MPKVDFTLQIAMLPPTSATCANDVLPRNLPFGYGARGPSPLVEALRSIHPIYFRGDWEAAPVVALDVPYPVFLFGVELS